MAGLVSTNYRMPAFDVARVIQVIETTLQRRGTGTEASPIRVVRQYWSLDGQLLAEVDPVADERRQAN